MRSNCFDETYRVPKDIKTTVDKTIIREKIAASEKWLEFFEVKISSMNKRGQRKSRRRYMINYYRHRRIIRDMRKRLNAL